MELFNAGLDSKRTACAEADAPSRKDATVTSKNGTRIRGPEDITTFPANSGEAPQISGHPGRSDYTEVAKIMCLAIVVLAARQLLHRAVGMMDGLVGIGIGAGVRISDGNAAELAANDPRILFLLPTRGE